MNKLLATLLVFTSSCKQVIINDVVWAVKDILIITIIILFLIGVLSSIFYKILEGDFNPKDKI